MLVWTDDSLLHWVGGTRVHRLRPNAADRIVTDLACAQLAASWAGRTLGEAQILWRHGDISSELQFLAELHQGHWGLLVILGGARQWFEGDLHSLLATVPDPLFDEVNHAVRAVRRGPLAPDVVEVDADTVAIGWHQGELRTVLGSAIGAELGDQVFFCPAANRCLVMRTEVQVYNGVRSELPYFFLGDAKGVRPLNFSPPDASGLDQLGFSAALSPAGDRFALSYWEELDGSWAPSGRFGYHHGVFALDSCETVQHQFWGDSLRRSEIALADLALSPQGELASYEDGELMLEREGAEDVYIGLDIDGPLDLAFSPSGDALALVSKDGSLGFVVRRENGWRR